MCKLQSHWFGVRKGLKFKEYEEVEGLKNGFGLFYSLGKALGKEIFSFKRFIEWSFEITKCIFTGDIDSVQLTETPTVKYVSLQIFAINCYNIS